MATRSIADLDLAGKRVFIRVDFNVPLKDGKIGDDTRVRSSLPTIARALERGAAVVVLASHLGRPKGKPNPQYSLRPVADRLAELLGRPVTFAEDCVGPVAEAAVKTAQAGGGVVLLEEQEETIDFEAGGNLMLTMDAPEHTRYRKLVNRGFTPRQMRMLEPHIRELTAEIIDRVIEEGGCDYVVDEIGRATRLNSSH